MQNISAKYERKILAQIISAKFQNAGISERLCASLSFGYPPSTIVLRSVLSDDDGHEVPIEEFREVSTDLISGA